MGKVLHAVNMGGHIYGEDLKKSDMPTYRTRIAFFDKDGKAVYGDVSLWRLPVDQKKPNGAYRAAIAHHMDVVAFHDSNYLGVPYKEAATWGYLGYYEAWDKAKPTAHEYTKKGVLEWVNGLLADGAERYDRIEFTDDYEAWTKTGDVAAVLAAQKKIEDEGWANREAAKKEAEKGQREREQAFRAALRAKKVKAA